MAKGLRPKRSLRQAMAHEISMYAITQVRARLKNLPFRPFTIRVGWMCSRKLRFDLSPEQKDGLGMDRAVEICKDRMSRYAEAAVGTRSVNWMRQH